MHGHGVVSDVAYISRYTCVASLIACIRPLELKIGPSGFRTREFHPFLVLGLNPRIWAFRFLNREFGRFWPLTLVFPVIFCYFPCYFGVELGLKFRKTVENNKRTGLRTAFNPTIDLKYPNFTLSLY